jgi:hypothetical protein
MNIHVYDPTTLWGNSIILMDGQKLREELRQGSSPVMTLTNDGENEVVVCEKANQVDISAAGQSRMKPHSLLALRHIPKLKAELISDLAIEDDSLNKTVRLRGPGVSLSVDPESGFVYSARYAAGEYIRLIEQREPVIHDDGIIFPSLQVTASFNHDQLTNISLYVIEEVVFNNEHTDDEFTVSTREGALLVDRRDNQTEPNVRVIPEPSEDVVTAAGPSTNSSALPWGIVRVVILVIAIAGVCFVVVLFLRK